MSRLGLSLTSLSQRLVRADGHRHKLVLSSTLAHTVWVWGWPQCPGVLTVVDGEDENPFDFFNYHKQPLLRGHEVSLSPSRLPNIFQYKSFWLSDLWAPSCLTVRVWLGNMNSNHVDWNVTKQIGQPLHWDSPQQWKKNCGRVNIYAKRGCRYLMRVCRKQVLFPCRNSPPSLMRERKVTPEQTSTSEHWFHCTCCVCNKILNLLSIFVSLQDSQVVC